MRCLSVSLWGSAPQQARGCAAGQPGCRACSSHGQSPCGPCLSGLGGIKVGGRNFSNKGMCNFPLPSVFAISLKYTVNIVQ